MNFFPLSKYPFHLIFLVLLLLLQAPLQLRADDPGISKARLIQTGESSYTFETEISQQLLWALKVPIFPERFEVTQSSSTSQSGWVTMRVDISSDGDPLTSQDQIVLPWVRNAVEVSAQWLNGDNYKGIYKRQFEGIIVPLKELMPTSKTGSEIGRENFATALEHFPFRGIHILFIIALLMLIPGVKALKTLLYLSTGQMLAMLTVGFHQPFSSLLYADLLFVLLIFIMAYCLAYGKSFRQLGIALLLVGFVHGSAYLNEAPLVQALPSAQKVQALFAFNIGMDVGHYSTALPLWALSQVKSLQFVPRKKTAVLLGSLSVFLMLLMGSSHLLKGNTQVIASNENPSISFNASGGSEQQKTVQNNRGQMTTPIMVFLSVEPYEVRQEILIMGRAANELLNFNPDNEGRIAVSDQPKIKQDLLQLILQNDEMTIDQKKMEASESTVNFVTLGPGGVAIRENAVEENIQDARIGISLLYEHSAFPDSILTRFKVFPHDVKYIEYQSVDPHANSSTLLTLENNSFMWASKIKGYKVKAITPIAAAPSPRPYLSYLLWCIMGLVLFGAFYQKKSIPQTLLTLLLALSFVSFAYARFPIDSPMIPEGKPSSEKAETVLNDLLGNVYRAFDRRSEDAVYDRLVLSVTEEQLTDIYLQNRQAMALEKRGGARANVDEVNIVELYSVESSRDNTYVADVAWTVRGSVNHFGHTHYRQNQYRALVSFLIQDGVWKISGFEILDTQRLY